MRDKQTSPWRDRPGICKSTPQRARARETAMRRKNSSRRRVPGANSHRQISLSSSRRRIDRREVGGRQGARCESTGDARDLRLDLHRI
jgi:hypothetical protein